ncbi:MULTISPECIES: DUF190 domain-containing protein [Deinococcus]|uniref:Uncharacterized protein n=5 Tax=Deinococcus TaxID=1298 RepID=A0A100HMS8_9DEIO|nr:MULTISPECIES: DUF190 domain-containing protein [Deinococcus]MXV21244.1 hypothetical protein [Deinococcus xianganensis]BBN97120.1 hypothetical protein DEGR_38530 [Deinococcus grandis]GAQ23604.1 hypothetical protein DEIGR_320018 [Deinococcus grandis]GGL19256.1 hypothetical protein GCM10010844_42760 [Deinococcus radiotolerans]GGR71491.1 hypothetical protein GCM10008959_36460 [Deinococcus seoulensis]
MSGAEPLCLLRCYTRAGDQLEGRPLADVVIETARALDLTLAFAQHGAGGFGRRGQVANPILLEMRPAQQPIIVQILGQLTQLDALLINLHTRGLPDRLCVLEPFAAFDVQG